MKKLLFTFLAAMCCMAMNAQDVTFTAGGIKYNVTGENTVEVVKNDSEYTGDVEIPATVTNPDDSKTYNVTGIGDNAFYNCFTMSSVTIPKGVTSIGDNAFYNCFTMSSVTIPEGVTSIGASAFKSCKGLDSITIPEGVTSIGTRAFDNTGWYKNQKDGLLYLCNYLVDVKGENTTTDIVITDGTMTIADEALRYCKSLVSITIPKSVTSIGDMAFPVYLDSITVDSDNPVYDSHDNCNAIIETATNTLIAGCKYTIIPSDVTSIGNNAFIACDKLTSVTIPSGVTYIGNKAFFNCDGLTEISVFATTPPTLGSNAFYGVEKDIPVYVPDVETYTGWGGFTNLKKYVDLQTAKNEAIAEINDAMKDITTFTEAEEQSIQLCKENINAATTLTEIKSNKDAALVIIKLRPFKDKAIADLQIFINEEKIANPPMEKYESSINAATAKEDIPSIVNDIKAEISNYTKFTLGEWKYLLDKNDEKYTIVGGSLTFTDKDIYQCDYNFTANNLTYSRTFNNTNWQPLYVPFAISYDEWKGNFDVAAINNFHEYSDDETGEIVKTELEVRLVKDHTLKPNHPYLIRAKMADNYNPQEINLSTKELCKSEEDSIVCSSVERKYTFTGTYQDVTGMKTKDYIFLSGGKLCRATDDNVKLSAQRWYLSIESLGSQFGDNNNVGAKAFSFDVKLLDDETTGIDEVTVTRTLLKNCSEAIYNLNGMRVNDSYKGIVIKNGKKVYQK